MELGSGILDSVLELHWHTGLTRQADIVVHNANVFYPRMKLTVIESATMTPRGDLDLLGIHGNELLCADLPTGTTVGDFLALFQGDILTSPEDAS